MPVAIDTQNTTNCLPINKRHRRNRRTQALRSLCQETLLTAKDFVAPLFVIEGEKRREEIEGFPGVARFTIDLLLKEIEELVSKGITAIDLFPVLSAEVKDSIGSVALDQNMILFKAIQAVRSAFPDLCIMVDVALDPYTSHGHDGIIDSNGYVLNDPTVEQLVKLSILSAQAGADIIAPSDMMDGRVRFIRKGLDEAGFIDVGILAYSAKYASSFYGPFRNAVKSSHLKGDKKSYQMDPANRKEALLEAQSDIEEGADMLLVKPALAYLDILYAIKESSPIPVGAYHVSGEYAMVKAAGEQGMINADAVMYESLLSIKRAGADFILTYAAKEIADYISQMES